MMRGWVWSVLFLARACVSSPNEHGDKHRFNDMLDHPDRIKFLPGYPHELPSPWFSGYLEYELEGMQIHTHYMYVEAESVDKDPSEMPLIYWSNGGPGASSVFGLMTELGPLQFSDLSLHTREYHATGIPTPLYSPYGWTSHLGSLLVFDAPAPVGFSYCEDDMAGEGFSCLSWTDELASQNTYLALQAFYNKFPVLRDRPLFLTGESYAGIYIPTLARRIYQGDYPMNIQGFAVGDGCLGTNTTLCGILDNIGDDSVWKNAYFHVLFLAGHGQIPWSTYKQVLDVCGSPQDGSSFLRRGSTDCKDMLDEVVEEAGGFYEYALYDDCSYENGLLLQANFNEFDGPLEGALNDYPCGGGNVMEDYVTRTDVKEALHIPSGAKFYSVDNAVSFDYTPTEPDLRGFYKDVAAGLYGDSQRMLVYNGDTDPAITSFEAEDWTAGLGLNLVQKWRPWTLDGCRRMGGYVTQYEGNLDFLTIRGAGHLVPTYKPAATYAFIKAWIENEDFPLYDKDCETPPQKAMKGPRFGSFQNAVDI